MHPVRILLVEDNEGDILLTKEAFEESKTLKVIDTVKDGEAAIAYLEKRDAYTNAKTPDLILLDINLPKVNGFEVLQFIKKSNTTKKIPVVMLTTSSSKKDIMLAYNKNANCYVTKPLVLKDFFRVIKEIESFWLSLVQLPKN